VKVVRIGHPARFLPQVVNHCLDTVVQNSNGGEVVRGIKEDMNQLQKDIGLLRGGQKAVKWREWRELKTEMKKRYFPSSFHGLCKKLNARQRN
jgi:hypothetical protein